MNPRTMMIRVISCSILSVLGALLAEGSSTAAVAFDWFEYTGRDALFETPLPPGHYRNPILAGFHPDPSICRVGEDYYLINSTFAYFPGIPVFHSRDLVHWTQIGHVIDRPTQLNYDGLGVSRGIFAPAISHHAGIFYVVCTMVDGGGNFLVTATNPAGPWSDPVWYDFEGIDPSLFFDNDGRAWLVNNGAPEGKPLYEGHRAIWIQEFEPTTRKLVGPRAVLVNGGVDLAKKPIWIEGPHLFKRGGWYYLSCAEGGTEYFHSQVIFRSKSPTGPFAPWDKNPILTQRDLAGDVPQAVIATGHADMVIGPDSSWWSVFLGCRPYAGKFYNTGRETFMLPVTWTDDGWPQILPPGVRVPYVIPSPRVGRVVPEAPPDLQPFTGNFTWRDEFAGSVLSPEWVMLRQPHENWWKLAGGRLELTPRSAALSGLNNPTFLGRRLQHARFSATTRLAVPAAAGVSAGLVVFQNETHHYFLGVRRTVEGVRVFVEKWNGPQAEESASTIAAGVVSVELRVTGEDQDCTFAFATEPGHWIGLGGKADASVLSTQIGGGFVGAMVGLHARLEP